MKHWPLFQKSVRSPRVWKILWMIPVIIASRTHILTRRQFRKRIVGKKRDLVALNQRGLKRQRLFHHHRQGRKRPVPIISNIPQSISTRLKLPPIVIIWQLQRHSVGRLWDLRSVPTTNVRLLVPFTHPHPLSLSTPYAAARLALRDLVPSARRHEY